MAEQLQIRIEGEASLPTLIYLPGIHGDWTLAGRIRRALAGRARWVEFTYPRRLDWTLHDYAVAVREALIARGIQRGWLIAESFSSQVVWTLLRASSSDPADSFRPEGIILAGGFVRHPHDWQVRSAIWLNQRLPWVCWRVAFSLIVLLAQFTALREPAVQAELNAFVARRTSLDLQAITHRLRLIRDADLRSVARATDLPVYQLTALMDIIVPWPRVRRWLQTDCARFVACRILPFSTHCVLFSAPATCARQMLEWIASPPEVRQGSSLPRVD